MGGAELTSRLVAVWREGTAGGGGDRGWLAESVRVCGGSNAAPIEFEVQRHKDEQRRDVFPNVSVRQIGAVRCSARGAVGGWPFSLLRCWPAQAFQLGGFSEEKQSQRRRQRSEDTTQDTIATQSNSNGQQLRVVGNENGWKVAMEEMTNFLSLAVGS